MLRHLVFVLLLYVSGGLFLSFAALRVSQVGRRYFIYHGVGLSLLTLFNLLFLGELNSTAFWFCLLFIVFSLVYSLLAGTHQWLSWPSFVLALVGFFGVVFLDLQSFSQGPSLELLSNALFSILFLGFSLASMLLGHWYLVVPKLSIDELKRLTILFLSIIGVRLAFGTWQSLPLVHGKSEMELYRYLLSSPGIFILMRFVWGILGPVFLSYFIWGTVKIRSTQSATGILYVVVLCVLTGEILSQYLTFFYGIIL